jgi:hypothetical protein
LNLFPNFFLELLQVSIFIYLKYLGLRVCKSIDNLKKTKKMTNLLSSLVAGLTLASAPVTPVIPATPVTVVTISTVEYTPLLFGRCKITDHERGFVGRGNCDKVLKAYAAFREIYKE